MNVVEIIHILVTVLYASCTFILCAVPSKDGGQNELTPGGLYASSLGPMIFSTMNLNVFEKESRVKKTFKKGKSSFQLKDTTALK